MNQPTFLVIGATQCGTTTMCDLLAAHPDVFMTSPKEPHFYSRLATFPQRRDQKELPDARLIYMIRHPVRRLESS